MSHKIAKRVRHSDWRETKYEERVVKSRHKVLVLERGKDGMPALVRRHVPRVIRTLDPDCGRAAYKHRKTLARLGPGYPYHPL